MQKDTKPKDALTGILVLLLIFLVRRIKPLDERRRNEEVDQVKLDAIHAEYARIRTGMPRRVPQVTVDTATPSGEEAEEETVHPLQHAEPEMLQELDAKQVPFMRDAPHMNEEYFRIGGRKVQSPNGNARKR